MIRHVCSIVRYPQILLFVFMCCCVSPIYPQSSKSICDKAIPLIEDLDGKIYFAYTQKVQSGALSEAIDNARMILEAMTAKLSPKAIDALNKTRLVIYHCDPSLRSGLRNKYPFDLKRYDYLTLLGPKSKCEAFQRHPMTFDGRAWDSTVGAGVAPGRLDRNAKGALKCTVPGAKDICDTTSICDANIVASQSVPHHDPYWEENILVHEFAHTIMNVALPNGNAKEKAIFKAIDHVYQIYHKGICQRLPQAYACANADEMWAEASQAWFGATCRKDPKTNIGLTTPEAIKKNIPILYELLGSVYGYQNSIKKIPVYSGGCDKRQFLDN